MSDKRKSKHLELLQTQPFDAAHQIWLAGIGAYGKAVEGAMSNFENFSDSTTEFFEELVKRGEEIEAEVTDRLSTDKHIASATQRMQKVVDTATQFQEQQMERFEARMERMRGLLGLSAGSDKAVKLHAKLDKIENEIAALRAEEESSAAAKALRDRIARLTAEIDEIVEGEAPARKKPAKRASSKKASTRKSD